MHFGFVHPVMVTASLLALTACVSAAPASADRSAQAFPPLGVDLGASSARAPVRMAQTAHGIPEEHGPHRMPASDIQLVHEGHNDAHVLGTVNAVDPAQHKINLSHEPIPALGWPAMTMDFSVAPSVDLKAVAPGTRVHVTIEKGNSGMYEIQSVQPASGRR